AGLFGLVGACGGLFAPIAGKIADRRGPYAVIGLGTLVMSFSWLILGLWNSIAGLVVGIILIDFGAQGVMISNQHIIYALRPEARNRLNTVYMCGMFLGGAASSAASSLAWSFGGWPAVCIFGGATVTLALGLYLQARRARGPAVEKVV
ncbi:MFS transporter, partial [Singulisphaera rosea]